MKIQKKQIGVTPLMKQYYSIKEKYKDSILLFRMGDFFETFDEDAKEVSKILGITLTKRANGAAAQVPLAGFPYHALDTYLPKLVSSGKRVAICDQVEDPKLAKGIVKREVTEIVTPGTASPGINDKRKNNFLSSLTLDGKTYGLSLLDVSTGKFFLAEGDIQKIRDLFIKFDPKEIIINEKESIQELDWILGSNPFITEIDEWFFDYDLSRSSLLEHFKVNSLKGFGCDDMNVGIIAAGVILRYITNNIQFSADHITSILPIKSAGKMGLDSFTIRNLELFNSLSNQGPHGTLLSILDDTLTAGGGRMLRSRLAIPLTEKKIIDERLFILDGFFKDNSLRSEFRWRLSNSSDLERILGKFSRGSGTPRDMIGLKETLKLIPYFKIELKKNPLESLINFSKKFISTKKIVEKIDGIINDSPPSSLAKGGFIKNMVSEELDDLRKIARGGKDWIASMQASEREKTGISSLKVGYNKVFGYYIEVTKKYLSEVPGNYFRKQTLVNAERFITSELKEYEEKILTAEEKIIEIELKLFDELRSWILKNAYEIQLNAEAINELDVNLTLAEIAKVNDYLRPEITNNSIIQIKGSRHPVVEALMPEGEKFVSNDINMSSNENQIHLLTGPNMAGKSTYLRQIGLIVIMAQMGSFVPAKSAKIGIVDRLFTRVGASDNLAGGESTFMVEMTEAANILNNATNNSLVLLDEIGRGTATFDGLSLAWAITEYLHEKEGTKARTIFATHYHELTKLPSRFKRIVNYNVVVKETEGKILFQRKIKKGPCDKSYGIQVAQMAGLPSSVISRATEILAKLIRSETLSNEQITFNMSPEKKTPKDESNLKKELSKININELTPLEAINLLATIKKKNDL